jgi:hypothetical protein
LFKQILNGNKNEISRSNIINKIATIQNLISNSIRESENGLKPHSYELSFSVSSNLLETKKLKKNIISDSKILINKKIKILK